MRYIETFINHPIYSIIIGVALLLSLTLYLVSIRKQKDFAKTCVAASLSGALSLVLSLAVCFAVSQLFSTEKLVYRSVFSIFYTVLLFPFFAQIFKKTFAKSFDINGVTPYVLLAIFIARIGCSIEGCCQGRLYLATVEELLCLTCFVLIKSGKLKITFNQFYIGYMLWRFVAEFFKESYHLELIGVLSLVQYVAIFVILMFSIQLIKSKEIKNEKK